MTDKQNFYKDGKCTATPTEQTSCEHFAPGSQGLCVWLSKDGGYCNCPFAGEEKK